MPTLRVPAVARLPSPPAERMKNVKATQPGLELDGPDLAEWQPRDSHAILRDVHHLQEMVRAGLLGGSSMPEDAHPEIDPSTALNYHYFTLTMALNYQRNSYALWRAATATFLDPETSSVFVPKVFVTLADDALRERLLKHRLALQPVRHPEIWRQVGQGIVDCFDGDVRNLFVRTNGRVGDVLATLQDKEKKRFPYLSGNKICHYWLYVMEQYSDVKLQQRDLISVAPDTHVVKATCKLGLVSPEMIRSARAQEHVTRAWTQLLEGTSIQPIDVHTRLWLWSRAGFPQITQRGERAGM